MRHDATVDVDATADVSDSAIRLQWDLSKIAQATTLGSRPAFPGGYSSSLRLNRG
jgi:hypothetical protein